MKILLVYATYSSGTFTASEFIASELGKKNHNVKIQQAKDTKLTDFSGFDLIILSSPSWMSEEGKDGSPHIDFMNLIKNSEGKTFENKKFAVFGLGDEYYARFCGAVDHLV